MINKQNNNFGNNAVGINSTAVGYCTQTTNYGEFAAGILNKSTRGTNPNTPKAVAKDKNATLFSVGCGDDTGRKNAFEVKGDGSINISGVGNLQEKLKELADVSVEITLKKDPNNSLQYTLYVGDKNCGEINIPKDLFLKSAEYNSDDKKLIFTFVTTDDDNVVTEISIADLVDTYKAGNNVTIKDNTISVDFSPITLALNTKVDKSDFDYVVKVNDDNKGNIINAKLVVNNQTTGVSNNYDLILGDKDNNDSYIQIDSTRSKNPADLNKFGNITTYSPNSLHLIGRNNTNITGDCVYIKDKNDELFNWRMSFDDGFNMLCSGGDWMQFNNYDGLSVNSSYPTVFNDRGFQINSSTSNENGYDFRGYLSFKGEGFEIHCAEKEKSSTCFIKAQLDNAQNNNYGEDKLQFLDKSVEITPTKFKALDGTVQIEKGKNIKFKTSSSNTMRLTEGEGFKVFTNMYAEPDHATDITDYTDEEKALLSSNTVQKNILDLNKKVNDVALSVPKLWIDVCSTKDTALIVDDERVEIPAHRTTILYPTTSVYIADNTPNPECITRFDIHNYGIFSLKFNFSANKVYTDNNGVFAFNVKSLNLSAWDASKVTSFAQMFSMCKKLAELDVSGWDTSNAYTMAFMFYNCAVLTSLDVSGWDVSNVNNMRSMFSYSGINNLNISNWDTSSVKNMDGMFEASTIKELKNNRLCNKSTTTIRAIFNDCSNLTTLDASGWDTSNVINMYSAFQNCVSLKSLDVSGWDTSNVIDMHQLFMGCKSLQNIDLSNFDLSTTENIYGMFTGCTSLATLTFGEGFGKMKDECGTLDLSELSAWNNDSVKSLLKLYDRKSNGMGVITIKLHANAKAVLGEDGIAELTAKGYTIA